MSNHDPRWKLTDQRTEALLKGLRLGMTRRAAAASCGISKSTLYRWLEIDDGTLLDAIERAEGEAEAVYSTLVAQAASEPKNWTAAAWWLERRHHEEYGRRERVEMTVDLKSIVSRVASERGLDESEVMAEVERHLAESR